MSYGPLHVGEGVEWGGPAGATGCVNFTRMIIQIKSYTYPGACTADWNWTVTFTPSSAPAICAYGTQRKPGVADIIMISAGLLVAMGLSIAEPWVLLFIGPVLGSAIATGAMCGTPKQADVVISPSDWTTPDPSGIGTLAQRHMVTNFRNALWDFLCQCTPAPSGSPAPVSPPVTTLSKPTYLTVYEDIHIDNTEISTTIQALWQYFTTVNIGNNNSLTIGKQTADCSCPTYKLGTAHEGLSGDGELAVSGILGLSVIFTTLPPRVGVIEGDPDSIYTGAFINLGNAWGWQTRLYPSTTSWLAFPPGMSAMTKVGYSIPTDVVATIAEIVAA
jgi:hypothetical protein